MLKDGVLAMRFLKPGLKEFEIVDVFDEGDEVEDFCLLFAQGGWR